MSEWDKKLNELRKEGRVIYTFGGDTKESQSTPKIPDKNKTANRDRIFIELLKKQGLDTPEQEYKFHPERKWRFDFAYPEVKLAIEVEGGIYGQGKRCPTCKQRKLLNHGSISGIKRDLDKYNEATRLGWAVLRYPPDWLNKPETIDAIEEVHKNRRQHE